MRSGVRLDIPQTALAPTLAALLGLPLPVVSEHAPLTDVMDASPEARQRLVATYRAAKAAAAHGGMEAVAADAGDEAQLNARLFDASMAQRGMRSLALVVALLTVVAALAICRSPLPVGAP